MYSGTLLNTNVTLFNTSVFEGGEGSVIGGNLQVHAFSNFTSTGHADIGAPGGSITGTG